MSADVEVLEGGMQDHSEGDGLSETPTALRDGVREGIRTALEREDRRTGSWAARRLAAAGAAGVAAAVGLTVLFAGGPEGNDGPEWHLAVCGAAWAGLLVESFAFAFLRIRTLRIHFGEAAALGLIGLGLAALVGLACPDPHYLHWWQSTALGHAAGVAGVEGSAFCLGLCSALFLGFSACFILYSRGGRLRNAVIPALALCLLLIPAVALQSVAAGLAVGVAWGLGTAFGSYGGVATAIFVASRTRPSVQ